MKAKLRKNSNKHFAQADAIQAAADYGIDISMLIDNLKRTPEERIGRHQIALNTVKLLRKAKAIYPCDKEVLLQLEAIKELKEKQKGLFIK
jgi:hypothetical protein